LNIGKSTNDIKWGILNSYVKEPEGTLFGSNGCLGKHGQESQEVRAIGRHRWKLFSFTGKLRILTRPCGPVAGSPTPLQPDAKSRLRFSQTRPSQHAENQYEGFFKGMGATSKDSLSHFECPCQSCQPINRPVRLGHGLLFNAPDSARKIWYEQQRVDIIRNCKHYRL
jgi:hypothetical protein